MPTDATGETDFHEWRPIPPDLTEGSPAEPLGRRRLRTWALVLQSRRIPCRTDRTATGWWLLVPAGHLSTACRELRNYEQLNRDWPPPPPVDG